MGHQANATRRRAVERLDGVVGNLRAAADQLQEITVELGLGISPPELDPRPVWRSLHRAFNEVRKVAGLFASAESGSEPDPAVLHYNGALTPAARQFTWEVVFEPASRDSDAIADAYNNATEGVGASARWARAVRDVSLQAALEAQSEVLRALVPICAWSSRLIEAHGVEVEASASGHLTAAAEPGGAERYEGPPPPAGENEQAPTAAAGVPSGEGVPAKATQDDEHDRELEGHHALPAPSRPTSLRDRVTLKLLESAAADAWVTEAAINEAIVQADRKPGQARQAIARLRDRGHRIETAPRGDGPSGWRIKRT